MTAIMETVCSFDAPITTKALRKIAIVAVAPVTLATIPATIGALRPKSLVETNY